MCAVDSINRSIRRPSAPSSLKRVVGHRAVFVFRTAGQVLRPTAHNTALSSAPRALARLCARWPPLTRRARFISPSSSAVMFSSIRSSASTSSSVISSSSSASAQNGFFVQVKLADNAAYPRVCTAYQHVARAAIYRNVPARRVARTGKLYVIIPHGDKSRRFQPARTCGGWNAGG